MKGCKSQFRGNRTEKNICNKACYDSYCTNTTSSNVTVTAVSDMEENYHEDTKIHESFSTEENNDNNLSSLENLPSSDDDEIEVDDPSVENQRPDDVAVANDGYDNLTPIILTEG